MAAIILTRFKVQDHDKWRQVYDNHAEMRKTAGCLGTHIFRNAHDPNELVINLQWDSEENALKFFSSDDLRAAFVEAGMVGQPDTIFLEDAGRTPS
jgi:quinol monooxygenase YgiN